MKFVQIIKLMTTHLFFLGTFSAWAGFQVQVLNKSGSSIYYSYIVTKYNSWIEKEEKILTNRESAKITNNTRVILNNKYLIEFVDTQIPCSWVSTLGISYPHGWGITLLVNKKKVNTICINKQRVTNWESKAKFEYSIDNDGDDFIFFYNDGWWQNEKIFPTSVKTYLKNISQPLNLTTLDFLLFGLDYDTQAQKYAQSFN